MNERGISIEKIAPDQVSRYRDFIIAAGYHKYSFLQEISGPALADLFLGEIEAIGNSRPAVFIAKSQNDPIALLSLHRLNWDTEHFGMPMARISHILGGIDPELDQAAKKLLIKAGTEELKNAGIRHIAARLAADDIASIYALEMVGYYLADTIVEYYFNFRTSKIPKTDQLCELRLFQPSDLALVEKSVSGIFKDYIGRFHNDPNLDKKKADQLYENWLINSCKGLADDCILAFVEGDLAGITALKIHRELNRALPLKLGEVMLIGVVPGFRGKKVFTSMLGFAQNHFKGKIDLFRYATQLNNFHVNGVLVKLGFFLKCAFHTYHYYIPGG